MDLAKAYVQIVPSAEGIEGSLTSLFSGEATSAGSSSGESLANSLFSKMKGVLVSLGIGKAITDAINQTGEFETAMAKVSTLFTGSEEQYASLQQKILDVSSQTGMAATTLAEAAYSAESASIPVGMLESAIESCSQLAVAGFTDVDTALSATAKTMNAYGDTSEASMSRVQTVLLQTQNLGITTVGELGASLANVTPTAAAMGVSFEQIGAAMALMTSKGTATAQATTQLRAAMTELGKAGTTADQSFRAAAEGSEYAGMSFKEAIASGANLGDVFSLMQSYAESSGLSMVDLWGSVEAGNAAMMIASDIETFNSDLEAMSTTADVLGDSYGTMAESFGQSMNSLKESAKNLVTTLFEGQDISGSLDALLESAGNIGDKILTWITNGIGGIADSLPSIISGLFDFGAGLLESITKIDWIDLGTRIINGIISGLGTLGTKLIELVKNAVTGITGGESGINFAEIGQKIWDGATSIFSNATDWLKKIFGDAAGLITVDDFSSIGTAILGGVTSLIDSGGEFLKNLFDAGLTASTDEVEWPSIGDAIKTGATLALNGGKFLSEIFDAGRKMIQAINWAAVGGGISNLVVTGLEGVKGLMESTFKAAKTLVDNISWSEIGTHISSMAVEGLTGLQNLIKGVFEGAFNMVKAINWAGLGGVISSLVITGLEGVKGLIEGIFKGAKSLIDGIQWSDIGTGISDMVITGLTGVQNLMRDIFEGGRKMINAINWAGLGGSISSAMQSSLEGAGKVLEDAFTAAHSFITGIDWAKAGQDIQAGLGDVWSGITSLFGGVGRGVGTAAEGLGTAFANWITGDTGENEAAGAITQAVLDMNTSLDEGKAKLEETGKSLGAAIYESIYNELSADKMTALGSGVITDTQTGITNEEGNLYELMTAIGNTASDDFKVSETWTAAGTSAMTSLQTGITNMEATIYTQIGTIMDKVITDIGAKDWTGTGEGIITKIGTGMGQKNDIKTAAETHIKSAKDAFTNAGWNTVGRDIISGIVTGISNNSGTLYSKLRSVALSALAAAKSALGISSPSKVMRDEVGRWIPEGIAAGITANADVVEDAMNRLSTDMTSVDLQNAISSQNARIQRAASSISSTVTVSESSGLTEQIVSAVREGLSNATVNSYIDGELVTFQVSKRLGDEMNGRRFVYG